ncbi:MAG: glycosyltransferase family protein, partial [Planctomycetota bacterium]
MVRGGGGRLPEGTGRFGAGVDLSAPVVVGIDATTWFNDRGFGRFTRGIVSALVRRAGDRFRYVLFVDQEPGDSLPEGAVVEQVTSRSPLTQSAVGAGSRTLGYAVAMGLAMARAPVDVIFFPAVYSYVPFWARTPAVVAFHDVMAEWYPALFFPTWRNRLLWRLK